ncbi:imidazolonepropionase [Idiomarina seosinensis]|uniref:imidazolonepropionase n=1 Tax=Idiomarina seosinensis TaxID=281739 RepID=UPI003850FAE6
MQRIENIQLATMAAEETGYGIIADAVVIIENDRIYWAGPASEAPVSAPAELIDGHGQLLTPALIDCHTHLVWAGSRAAEFAQRLHGASYADIARAGGGIATTVKATRAASFEHLLQLAEQRAHALLEQGVGALEIKSGYGLELQTERKQLQVARELGQRLPLTVTTTLLAAHAIPPEFEGNADGYIDEIVNNILPTLAEEGLVDAVDAFCESIGFSVEQTERVFKAAQQLKLPVKLHAEQITNQQGTALAARFQALSADHLEQLDESGVKAMAENGTVAVLLPGAFYFLRDTQVPPVELLRRYGVPIALATDANPGSSPIHNLPLMLQMGATLFRLTPEECLRGVTINAAKALGLSKRLGQVKTGMQANLALWDVKDPAELSYQFGVNPLSKLWLNGDVHGHADRQ